MSYSCSDLADDMLNGMVNVGWIGVEDVEEDDPESQANLLLRAIADADSKLQRVAAATLFHTELLDAVETIGGIADEHGPTTLANVVYMQAAILNGTTIELHADEASRLSFVRGLPSGERWWKSVTLVAA